MDCSDISEVLLVGGSSKAKWMREVLNENLAHVPLNDVLRAEEGVAEGAAILAYELSHKYLAIGLKVAEDKVHYIVREVVSLPFEYSHEFFTIRDNQKRLIFEIVQGENQSIDRTKIPVQPELAGQQSVKMTIRVDLEGWIQIKITRNADGHVFELKKAKAL